MYAVEWLDGTAHLRIYPLAADESISQFMARKLNENGLGYDGVRLDYNNDENILESDEFTVSWIKKSRHEPSGEFVEKIEAVFSYSFHDSDHLYRLSFDQLEELREVWRRTPNDAYEAHLLAASDLCNDGVLTCCLMFNGEYVFVPNLDPAPGDEVSGE